jgi:phage terminase large subunit GpA-like protein
MDARAFADEAWRAGLKAEPALTVSAWADRYRQLSSKDSAEPGPWRTARTPYLAEIMDCLSPASPVEVVVVQAAAQTGKTACGLNWLGYIVHQAPGPTLIVQPTIEMARRFSRQRLDPLFEASPILRELVAEPRSRDAANTMLGKEFPGGTVVITGANSPTGLRSMPVRFLFLDEIDAYPADAAGEGDPVALAMARTATFARRKVLMTSTPTIAGFSRIEAAYLESDQRRYVVPCLECGDLAPIVWARIRWPKGKPQHAYLACDACGAATLERHKPALLRSGRWQATAPGDGRVAGFQLSALCSPWRSWGDIAVEHARVHKDPARLQAWVNGVLAETWEDVAGEVVPADPLMARRETWDDLPAGVKVLTAGVDLQSDRIELQVVGWGLDEECWALDYKVLVGDPSGPRVWADLDVALAATYRHASGVSLGVRATCVDTGGLHSKAAYDYCRTRHDRRVWAIKGRGGPGVPPWPRRPSRSKVRTNLYMIGVDALKDALAARLRLTEPGPGFVHFHRSLDGEYFRQLTAEHAVTRFVKGRPVRAWALRRGSERNEALDTLVYASAALHGLISLGLRLDEERPGRAKSPPKVIRSRWLEAV